MAVQIVVPSLGESITEATIEKWLKNPGDAVAKEESLVSIESDKATVEIPAPVAGVLGKILRAAGERVKIGEVIGELEERAASQAAAPAPAAPQAAAPAQVPPVAAPAAPAGTPGAPMGPAARRLASEAGLEPESIAGTGRGGRVLKEDVQRQVEAGQAPPPQGVAGQGPAAAVQEPAPAPAQAAPATPAVEPRVGGPREEQLVPLSPLRRTIAARLVQSKQQTAMLTTFNEVDMSRVMALRARHQPKFLEKHGVKLGLMSFFVKATIEALKAFPQVNGELRDDSVVYKNYYDIGVAVGSGKGLTVPVVRDADQLSFAQCELVIADLGKRAQANKLKLEELRGGTFTISNGGVYGSLLSTPILNPPQVGILGMHNIVKRPVVVDDEIVARPMMYLALSYDHRIIDGREAVQFLIRIKECVEDPERILLEI